MRTKNSISRFCMLIFFGALISCNSGNKNADELMDTITNYDTGTSGPAETTSECYENINGKDTVFLSLFSEAKVITGSLMYNYYEKDKNSGAIKGNMYGDTLIAEYVFNSEGNTSIREVAFLKQDSKFVEGYGDVEEKNDKLVFKNRNSLKFTGKPLTKVDCR